MTEKPEPVDELADRRLADDETHEAFARLVAETLEADEQIEEAA